MSLPEKLVLSQQLKDAIRGRSVRAAVFLTYEFDPRFFELNVIPLLFERTGSPQEKVSLVLSEEALREGAEIAVYYDRRGLQCQDGGAVLDYRRFDLSRPGGVFHPKMALLLLKKEEDEEEIESLLVLTTSANLTQSGWWENIECAHILEITEGSRTLLRQDLLGNGGLLNRLAREDKTGAEHRALDMIRTFLQNTTNRTFHRSKDGLLHPRLFLGQQELPAFLAESLGVGEDGWSLEVISPFFDGSDEANTLGQLRNALGDPPTRIFLPRGRDGSGECREGLFRSIVASKGVEWGELPAKWVQRSDAKEKGQARERYVHAKVYRLFSPGEGKEYIFSGSINLTRAAHSSGSQMNFETGLLYQNPVPGKKLDWWMRALASTELPEHFEEKPAEGENGLSVHDFTLEYNWATRTLRYYWGNEELRPPEARLLHAGVPLFEFGPSRFDQWITLPQEAAGMVGELLASTSIFQLSTSEGEAQEILIREERMDQKPPLLATLTPEEILEYWSLLSPEQKAAILEKRLLDQIPGELSTLVPGTLPVPEEDTMFDRFAGVFHAFSSLRRRVEDALEKNNPKEAIHLLFGKKHDSLGSLLEMMPSRVEENAVMPYLVGLCANQIIQQLGTDHREFMGAHQQEAKELKEKLGVVEECKKRMRSDIKGDADEFFRWFEENFLTQAVPPEGMGGRS